MSIGFETFLRVCRMVSALIVRSVSTWWDFWAEKDRMAGRGSWSVTLLCSFNSSFYSEEGAFTISGN